MKILIADKNRAFCLHLPLMLLCNRAGAALLASGLRHAQRLPDGSVTVSETSLITTGQMHGMLKAIRQSKQRLKRDNLPLIDVENGNGERFMVML